MKPQPTDADIKAQLAATRDRDQATRLAEQIKRFP